MADNEASSTWLLSKCYHKVHSRLMFPPTELIFLCIFHKTLNEFIHDKTDVSYLTNLPGASQRLRIFNADLDKPESFSEAIKGCVGVFHIAHPMNFGDQEIEDKKIRRTVDGTLGVLQECLNSKTVKRVVYTSSRTAVVFHDKGLDTVNESSWSDIHVMKTLKPISAASYVISKTLAEKAALEFAEKHGLDLMTVIPSWIHGPFLSTHFPEPLRSAMAMIYGMPLLLFLQPLQLSHVKSSRTLRF